MDESLTYGYSPSFKQRVPFESRLRAALEAKRNNPDKVPVIIERYEGEKSLPALLRCKYLVPSHITIAELVQIVRRKMDLHPSQSFFLLVKNQSLVSNSTVIGDQYAKDADDDGFLYITYANQLAFGAF